MLTEQRKSRLKSLVTCLSAALAVAGMAPPAQAGSLPQPGWSNQSLGFKHRFGVKVPPPVPNTIRNVLSCADDGSVGTLRQVIGIAADNDYIDLSGASCSTITLMSGEIATVRNGLTLHGPTDRTLTITTTASNRLLHHTGTGYLTIDHLTLTGGKYFSSSGSALGGCVNSSGGVNLYTSVISGCGVEVTTTGAFSSVAGGGAVFAARQVTMSHSRVTGNTALALASNKAQGGGVLAASLSGDYSTFSGNSAVGAGGSSIGEGGAAAIGGTVYLVSSIIDSNQADLAGGLYQVGSSSDKITIRNSTISGNSATVLIGALYASSPLGLYNSTVAFNSANSDAAIDSHANVKTYSSIIAKNSISTGTFADMYISPGHTLGGADNLIMSSNLGLPFTVSGNPRLAPLANHGGETRTHALLAMSPAINAGDNVLGSIYDQRGVSFARSVPTGVPDIGAYERQVGDDEVFYDGLE